MSGPDDDSRDAGRAPSGKEKENAGAGADGKGGGRKGPVDLDGRRSAMGRMEAQIRRDLLADIRSGQAAERRRQEAFEDALFARPAATWAEAAAKAEYLLQLFAATPHARAPGRQRIVTGVLDDLGRLAREERAREERSCEEETRDVEDQSGDAGHAGDHT